ncbi:MAG: AMP-binding protein [Halioglobus sp.]
MTTVAELIRAQADNSGTALLYEDQRWSYREYVQACAQRAAWLLEQRAVGRSHAHSFQVGVLLDNVPEYLMWLGACALSGTTLVGLNPTRHGADLERDIHHTECSHVISNDDYWAELQQLELVSTQAWNIESMRYRQALKPYLDAALPEVEVMPGDTFCLIFTSGTTGAPKACLCSHSRITANVQLMIGHQALCPDDISYVAMPLFHSNAIMSCVLPSLGAGAAMVLRRKFSASGFLPDVRRYGVTYFSYVGKPLAYILATPEQPDDADNSLRRGFGNEAAYVDMERFEARFDCTLMDAYGSTEGGVAMVRDRDSPPGSLGLAMSEGIQVMNAESLLECPRAEFDDRGMLANGEEAIGELVNTAGLAEFEGYWKHGEADAKRTRGGIVWMGDRAYRDDKGYFYFAGRDSDSMRVDGENIATAQVEQLLTRHPDVVVAAVYPVPDPEVGDRVMAAIQVQAPGEFDAEKFAEYLSRQEDFSSKWMPMFIRVATALPLTHTSKVIKHLLRREKWNCTDPVWWQSSKSAAWREMTGEDVLAWERLFARRGRAQILNLA